LLIRIVRSLTPEEVYKRISGMEERYGITFGEFEDRFLKRERPAELLSVYLEWAGLVDAYRGYEEGGDLDFTVEETREFNTRQLAKLTPKRLELLGHLAGIRVESINELAHRIRRDVKNVYEDLLALRELNLLQLKRSGKRKIVPETFVEEIAFLIR
jgi:hypothetical protein